MTRHDLQRLRLYAHTALLRSERSWRAGATPTRAFVAWFVDNAGRLDCPRSTPGLRRERRSHRGRRPASRSRRRPGSAQPDASAAAGVTRPGANRGQRGCGNAPPPAPALPDDPIPLLFAQFAALTAAQERAFARAGRLEAGLAARLGWPRVRLPAPLSAATLFAADPDTVDRHVPQGPLARRLKRRLRRRQWVWDAEADACGLADALRHEASVSRAVRAAGAVLTAQPAATLAGLRLKLVVLLALHAPGGACDATEPWGGLHTALVDLAALAAQGRDGS